VTVNLLDGAGNPLAGKTTTTNASGYYGFSNLEAGSYKVEFVKPVGYSAFSPADQGANDAVDSDANPSTGMTTTIALTAGQNDLRWDAGLYQYASLGDFVWFDENSNGIQDPGEAGVEGVIVNLLDANGNPTGLTTTTSASGYYLFGNMVPGSYRVEFVLPDDYDGFTLLNIGSDITLDCDADLITGITALITLSSGQHDLTWDAGLLSSGGGDDEDPIAEPAALGALGIALMTFRRRRS